MIDSPFSVPPIDVQPSEWIIVRDILRRRVPEREVWAFGSRAKHTAKPFSDLDLVIISHEPMPLDVHAALIDDFSESDLPWKVDVLDWALATGSFRDVVVRDKVVVQLPGGR